MSIENNLNKAKDLIQDLKATMDKANISTLDALMYAHNHVPEIEASTEEVEDIEDIINKPDHYHKGGLDIYQIMAAKLSPEEYKGFCKGNILKYLLRADLKGNPVQDLEKCMFNLERLIEVYKGIPYNPKTK